MIRFLLAIFLSACSAGSPTDVREGLVNQNASKLTRFLSGAWQRQGAERVDTLEFRKDGTHTLTIEPGNESDTTLRIDGRYAVERDRLALTVDDGVLIVSSSVEVYINQSVFVQPAYYPLGTHKGIEGQWLSTDVTSVAAQGETERYERRLHYDFRSQQRYVFTQTVVNRGSEPVVTVEQGSYVQDGDRFLLSSGESTRWVSLVDNAVLADEAGAFTKVQQ